jgi:coenzyme F420-dependent glucose-6-phosphate dehydrogenase
MVKIGWKAGPEQYPPDQLLDQLIAAEKAGFQSIDVSDHFHPWSDEGQACFTWTWLGAAATHTKTIELGTGITCPILRYHPSVVAQAAATVAYMSHDRFYLGVGTGEALNEYSSIGVWPGYNERQTMLGEAIMLMRELWKGEPVTYSGEYYYTKKARLYTLTKKMIPIYVSSMVPHSAYFAGKYGDGLITVGGQKPELYKEILKNFAEGAKEAGKDPTKMPKLIELNAAYTDDKQAAIQEMKKYWAGTFIPALFDQKIYTPSMSAQNGEAVGSDTIEQKTLISSNAQDHIDFLKQYIDLGFTHLYMHCAGPDQIAFLENYGKNVIPKVQA